MQPQNTATKQLTTHSTHTTDNVATSMAHKDGMPACIDGVNSQAERAEPRPIMFDAPKQFNNNK